MQSSLSFGDPVTAVVATFGVVVGVALERFLTESEMVGSYEKTCPNRWLRWLFFWSSLTMLASLILRFMMGAAVQLRAEYVENQAHMPRFIKDEAFLIVFGVLLVKVGLSKEALGFMRSLIWFFVVAVVWSLIAMASGTDAGLARFWLEINAIQLVVTAVCRRLLVKKPGFVPQAMFLCFLAICYLTIFCFDLRMICNKANIPI